MTKMLSGLLIKCAEFPGVESNQAKDVMNKNEDFPDLLVSRTLIIHASKDQLAVRKKVKLWLTVKESFYLCSLFNNIYASAKENPTLETK